MTSQPFSTDMTTDELLTAARSTLKKAEYCFFITLSKDGLPSARVMQPYEPDPDMTMFFGASPHSRKVQEIREKGQATIAFFDPQKTAYVTLAGTATIVDDMELRRKHWRVFWNDIYPGGPEGDEYVLIRFSTQRIEMMNFTEQAMPRPYGLKPTVVVREKEQWRRLGMDDSY